jgi:hypothetical protein
MTDFVVCSHISDVMRCVHPLRQRNHLRSAHMTDIMRTTWFPADRIPGARLRASPTEVCR